MRRQVHLSITCKPRNVSMHPSNKNSYKSKRRDVTYLPAELTDEALVRPATGSDVTYLPAELTDEALVRRATGSDVTDLPAELTDEALVRRAPGSVVEHALLVFLSSGDVDYSELVRLAAVTETLRQLHAHVTSTYRLDYSADRQCPLCVCDVQV